MRKFTVKQAVYTKNRRGKLEKIKDLILKRGQVFYKNIVLVAEKIMYAEKKQNHTVLYEGKTPIWSGHKPDDGQMEINERH